MPSQLGKKGKIMGKEKESILVKINRDELVSATFTDSALINKAVTARAGETRITIEKDSDGNEYARATYELKQADGKRTEITTSNMELATRIERVNRAIASGDVAYFITAKELENFTETEATELGFDSVVAMASSIFGLAKSTIENYRKLSRFFIKEDYTLVGAIPKDTPISTLNQLISYVTVNDDGTHDISNVERLFTSNIITPYMKQAELKARLAKLKSMDSEKEISELSPEELESVKAQVQEDSLKRKEEKTNKAGKKEKKEEKATVTVSDNPQVVLGEILSMLSKIENYAIYQLSISRDSEIRTHIDALMVLFSDMINDLEA